MPPVSFSTITPGDFELTPCRVNYKGVDLGATMGNVKVSIKGDLAELKADQLGKTVIDRKVSGFNVTVETALAEIKNKENWKVIFPAHKLISSGGNKSFLFDSKIGTSMADLAGPLILHPLSKADGDLSEDILIYKATANGGSEIEFGAEKQIGMKVHWDMYPDFATSPPKFMFFGDPAVGAVAASAGSATPGSGNTGGGTVGSIVAEDGAATETVTMVCEKPGSAGTFYVSGNVSGPIGLATVGIAFTSDQIHFTIADGSPDFVSGDSFTIPTTAANYA